MNQYQVKRMARHLIESEEKFVTTVMTLLEIFERFSESQRAFDAALDARDIAYQTSEEAGRLQRELVDKLLESTRSLQIAYQATHVAVQQNTERMERLLAKMETYFGTTGLDYDN